MYSVVIPVYRNAESVDALVDALETALADVPEPCELVFVVDGSPDDSRDRLLARLPSRGFSAQVVLLSRNFGSFSAIRAGLAAARGERFAVVAADLQEPPELLVAFHRRLTEGAKDVVFGRRTGRADPSVFSRGYWALFRRFVMRDVPATGVDTFACSRKVRETILSIGEQNTSLVALLFWVGFQRDFVDYERRERVGGKSAWSLSKRVRYLVDSVYGFTDLPILLLTLVGLVGMAVSVLLGVAVVTARLVGGIEVPGYTALMIAILFFGTLNLFGIGVVGGYIWRTFENTKSRPGYIVSDVVDLPVLPDRGAMEET